MCLLAEVVGVSALSVESGVCVWCETLMFVSGADFVKVARKAVM